MRAHAFALALLVTIPAAVVPSASGLAPQAAEASVSILISLEELVATSSYVVVGTALDRHSVWEDLAGGRRIVTYTRLKVDDAVIGSPGAEIMVRTLGGAVGRIGQQVSGEASISLGSTSLLFLTHVEGAVMVTGMAQGHYPIVTEPQKPARLVASPDAGALLPRRGPTISAREQLVGTTVDTATGAVKRVWRVLNGKK